MLAGFSLSAKDWPLLLPVRSSVTTKLTKLCSQIHTLGAQMATEHPQCPRFQKGHSPPVPHFKTKTLGQWVSTIDHSHIYSARGCTVVTLNGSKVSAHFLMPLMLSSWWAFSNSSIKSASTRSWRPASEVVYVNFVMFVPLMIDLHWCNIFFLSTWSLLFEAQLS